MEWSFFFLFAPDNLQDLMVIVKAVDEMLASSSPWPQFHQFLASGGVLKFAEKVGASDAAVNLLLLQYCEETLAPAKASHHTSPTPVTDPQADILQYIAGALLCKLRKRYLRQNRTLLLEELNGLSENKYTASKFGSMLMPLHFYI